MTNICICSICVETFITRDSRKFNEITAISFHSAIQSCKTDHIWNNLEHFYIVLIFIVVNLTQIRIFQTNQKNMEQALMFGIRTNFQFFFHKCSQVSSAYAADFLYGFTHI